MALITSSHFRVRNRRTWRDILARLRGSPVVVDLRGYDAPLDEISRLEPEIHRLSDEHLIARAGALRLAVHSGSAAHDARVPRLALAREAARRALGQRPFDEQLVAALAMSDGAIVEMQTGEGKTLAGALLAAHWMAPVYALLGVSVGFVEQGMAPDRRRAAYAADVTYVRATEAGFDYLRDGLATAPEQLVQRPRASALVDEADSLLIDEAGVPLVLAGAYAADVSSWPAVNALVSALAAGLHFDTDERLRQVQLTEAGFVEVERALGCGSLHERASSHVNGAYPPRCPCRGSSRDTGVSAA